MPLAVIPEILATIVTSRFPGSDEDLEARAAFDDEYAGNLLRYDISIKQAVELGELPIRDPVSWERVPSHMDPEWVVVSVKDLCDYLEKIGSSIQFVLDFGCALDGQSAEGQARNFTMEPYPNRSAAPQSYPADTGTEVPRYSSPNDALAYERRITEAADAILQEQADYALLVGGAPMIAAALGGVPAIPLSTAPAARPSAVPVQRSAAQDAKILEALRARGYDPKDLPVPARGKAGVKAEIRKALAAEPLFLGVKVFNKAWQRMRENDDIADGT